MTDIFQPGWSHQLKTVHIGLCEPSGMVYHLVRELGLIVFWKLVNGYGPKIYWTLPGTWTCNNETWPIFCVRSLKPLKNNYFWQSSLDEQRKSYIKPWDAKTFGPDSSGRWRFSCGIRKATWMLIAWWFMIPSWRNISRYVLLPRETDISRSYPLKNDGWKTTFFLKWSLFRGYTPVN